MAVSIRPGPPGLRPSSHVLPHRDPEQLGRLLLRLQPRLHSVALRLTRDPESARDVVQSAFEKVVRHGAGFQGHARVSTWVHRIVANEALMWLRSERRRSEVQDPPDALGVADVADDRPGPAEQLEQRTRYNAVHEGLARLPVDDRELLLRCVMAGMSHRDYGAATGRLPAAVKSRAHRARRRLHRLLVRRLEPSPG